MRAASLSALEDLNHQLNIGPRQLLEAGRFGDTIEVIDDEFHGLLPETHSRMLVGGMEDRSCVITINIVYDRLLAHEFKSLDTEEICRFEELHHVIQSDLALVCVQVCEHFDEHLVPDFFKSDARSSLVCLLVERSFLEHGCEVRAPAQEQLVGGDLALFWPIYDEGEIGVLRVRDPTLQVRGQR